MGALSISLSWHGDDDLDLHLRTPDGAAISYQNKRWRGGTLDVDMCVNGRISQPGLRTPCSTHPVENIVFSDLKSGRALNGIYEISVVLYKRHSSPRGSPVKFDILVRSGSKSELFSGLCVG